MTLSDRDKKIVLILAPLLLIGAFAFLVVKPKREEAVKAAQAAQEQREKRDAALTRESQLKLAKASFATDYATVVRLGKAVPADVDMASVLVQLERAAKGTGINFGRISAGERLPAAGGASGAGGGASSSASPPVAAGGAPAQTGSGSAVEKANNGAATSESATAKSESSSADASTQTSSSSGQGGLPAGGGTSSSTGASGATGGSTPVPGLDSVPLELRFTGNFFSLADFFHRLKRFVRVANDDLVVGGRLMTVDAFSFKSDQAFPKLEAELKARIYLSPPAQGATAGASPTGPSTGGGSATTTAGSTPSPSPASPTAAAPGIASP